MKIKKYYILILLRSEKQTDQKVSVEKTDSDLILKLELGQNLVLVFLKTKIKFKWEIKQIK